MDTTTSTSPVSETSTADEVTTTTTALPLAVAATKDQHISNLIDIGAILLSQGAEARTYRYKLNGLDCIIKERFEKSYRHPILDAKIANKRILMEVRAINRCRKSGISVPCLYLTDTVNNRIYMEYIQGITVKQYLYNLYPITSTTSTSTKIIDTINDSDKDKHREEIEKLCSAIGLCIGRMHDIDIIHGDLTTSNMMLQSDDDDDGDNNNNNNNNTKSNNINNHVQFKDEKSIIFIDFGLSYRSTLNEDKAVDLYVLERAFISTHPNSESLFQKVLEGYTNSSSKAKNIISRLDQVRLRGRKKLAFG